MNANSAAIPVEDGLNWQAVKPSKTVPDMMDDVRNGLFTTPRCLSAKYFYDALGSDLFDQICDMPEYYLTREENALLANHAADIIDVVRPDRIIELGSGASRKTRHLFDACDHHRCYPEYIPFDVCQEMLLQSGQLLIRDYDWLRVNALVGDYTAGLDHVPVKAKSNLVLFLGSTIGNFENGQAIQFLKELRDLMRDDGWLLMGVDRVKNPDVLHAAYNDAQGITAQFNRNILRVINKSSGANFDVDSFNHYACYNPSEDRIEMYLIPDGAQDVYFPDLCETLHLQEGEPIRTEVSCKYTLPGVESLLGQAGFSVERHYEAERSLFSLVLARPTS